MAWAAARDTMSDQLSSEHRLTTTRAGWAEAPSIMAGSNVGGDGAPDGPCKGGRSFSEVYTVIDLFWGLIFIKSN